MMNNMEEPDQEPEPPNNLKQPVWCKCGLCVIIPNLGREQMLHTNSLAMFEYKPTFYSTCFGWQCVGFGNALQGAEDMLAMLHPRNNDNFRHTAHRQFVLWQHGRLGQGNRRVVPSCCVIAIRKRYPSPNGIYVGYHPTRL